MIATLLQDVFYYTINILQKNVSRVARFATLH